MTETSDFPFPKDKTIGILGGGQLGRMLAMAAGRLGFYTIVLDPAKHCPASQFTNHQILASYDDPQALKTLAKLCQVVTFEFENIPVASANIIGENGDIFPGPKALEVSQDRLIEKQFIQSAGMETADYSAVSSRAELDTAIEKIGLPAILKTRRLGYDGKGQLRLGKDNLAQQLEALDDILKVECILEKMVDFECEISVIATRNRSGETKCYDPARNTHKDGILVQSQIPCELPDDIIENAKQQAITLMEKLDYVGVIGVEFFVTRSGELLINEYAPRVHNSGHWTEAACLISQFEQHIRAIVDLPLGTTLRHSDCVMENLIGQSIANIPEIAKNPNILIHSYGKPDIRDGRKMGHMTTLSPRTDQI